MEKAGRSICLYAIAAYKSYPDSGIRNLDFEETLRLILQ